MKVSERYVTLPPDDDIGPNGCRAVSPDGRGVRLAGERRVESGRVPVPGLVPGRAHSGPAAVTPDAAGRGPLSPVFVAGPSDAG